MLQNKSHSCQFNCQLKLVIRIVQPLTHSLHRKFLNWQYIVCAVLLRRVRLYFHICSLVSLQNLFKLWHSKVLKKILIYTPKYTSTLLWSSRHFSLRTKSITGWQQTLTLQRCPWTRLSCTVSGCSVAGPELWPPSSVDGIGESIKAKVYTKN